MRIKVWGVRGSIPVSGKEYIRYGGETTCIEIRTCNNEIIIIDAGTGIRRLGNLLLKEDLTHITMLFTHAHWDHLMGLPFFKPLYSPKYNITIHGCPFAKNSIQKIISKTMSPPYFPVQFSNLNSKIIFKQFKITKWVFDTITIQPVFISHPNKGVGYKITENGKSFVFITDNELNYKHPGGEDFDYYVDFVKGSDVLFHDSEYTGDDYVQTWGHSKYTEALELAFQSGVKQFGMIHHNQDRTDKEIDGIVKDAKRIISKSRKKLNCFAVYSGMEITL